MCAEDEASAKRAKLHQRDKPHIATFISLKLHLIIVIFFDLLFVRMPVFIHLHI